MNRRWCSIQKPGGWHHRGLLELRNNADKNRNPLSRCLDRSSRNPVMSTMTLCQSILRCRKWHLTSPTRSCPKHRRSWTSRITLWSFIKGLVQLSSNLPTILLWRHMSLSLLVQLWVAWYKKAREMQHLLPLAANLLSLSKFIRLANGSTLLFLTQELPWREDHLREQSDFTYNTE